MTQKEIDKFLANTKVYVNGKSKEIQEKLFSLGYYWSLGKCTEVINEDKPFLYVSKDYNITYGRDMRAFIQHEHREISAEEILSLELTEPSYRPFKNSEECWNEMLKHQPFGWLKAKESKSVALIGNVYMDKEVWIVWTTNEKDLYSASEIFNNYVFADGTPFGVKEE